MRMPLQQVTLVAIDTRAPALAVQSLLRSMAGIDFGRVMLFTHDWVPRVVLPGIELVQIEALRSGEDYSKFVLRQLPHYIRSSHVLITQWDGFVVDPAAWCNEFLACDYVGAVWPDQPPGCQVGNGGFSLRSRRLLQAGLDARMTDPHPEDQALCMRHRDWLESTHGVVFAPPALARRFAFENESPRHATFGFHGPCNLPRFVDEPTLATWFTVLPDDFFRGRDARRLARALLARRMNGAAQQLLQRRLAAGCDDAKTQLLRAVAAVQGVFSPRPG